MSNIPTLSFHCHSDAYLISPLLNWFFSLFLFDISYRVSLYCLLHIPFTHSTSYDHNHILYTMYRCTNGVIVDVGT